MKDFPAVLLKILPAALVLASLEACHYTSVSANSAPSKAPVVAPAGSVLRVRLDQALDTERSRPGDRFQGVLDSPLMANGLEILPKGTIVNGHVLIARPANRQDRAALSLVLDSCNLGRKELGLETDTVTRVGAHRRKRILPLVDGASGAIVGASIGGAPESSSIEEKNVFVPAESIVGFTLKSPVAV